LAEFRSGIRSRAPLKKGERGGAHAYYTEATLFEGLRERREVENAKESQPAHYASPRPYFPLARRSWTRQSDFVLRPNKKYSVYDLRQLKGKRCLVHVHVKSPEEAAAAEAAGIDLLSCSFDSPASQARLPLLVAAAPQSFISCATPHGLASPEEAIRVGFKALELGASSVYCSASPRIIEAMAREKIPVVGHLGMVPRHATWTNVRAIGKTAEEAQRLYAEMKQLESAGAYAAEVELVPHQLASYLCKKTSMLLMSLGSGSGCDSQFLFSDDILSDYDERIPRHAKAYRNFLKEYERLQRERVAAFQEYAADVHEGRFPEKRHLIEMEPPAFEKAVERIEKGNS
jgi:3-methyl-2-oxobutanoate hydroxymethyltransferase